jgi:hypothetical protein
MTTGRPAPYLTLALTAVTIAGCSDELTTANAGPGGEIVHDIGITARDEVEAALSALTLQTSLDPLGTTQAAAAPIAFSSPPCVTSSSPEDSDGDGVPDDAIYLFTAPPCRFTGWRGGTLDLVGQLRIQDPLPSQAGFGYEATLTGLRTRFTSADGKTINDITRNGTRVLSGSVSGLLLSADLQVIRTFTGRPDAAVDQQWILTFSPSGPLQINVPLPSGTLSVAGTLVWTRGLDNFPLTVTTPTPLQYNAGCTDTFQRIDAGELHASGTFDDIEGSVRVRWSECGREPSFSFIPAETE